MALLLITNPPATPGPSTNWANFIIREDKSNIGTGLSIPIFTLTNWDGTTTKPQIAQGSIVEVGGSLYQADVDTALTDEGGLIDGTVHIKLSPGAGSPDPLTVVPTLTNDALPAWDAVKGGWYTSANKYLPFEMTKASAVYTVKSEFIDQHKVIKTSSEGVAIIPTAEITTNNVVTQNMTGTMKWKHYFKDLSTTNGAIFTELSSWVPTTGGFMNVSCQAVTVSKNTINGIYRSSPTRILLAAIGVVTGTSITIIIDSGSGTAASIEIMSNFDEMT